MEYRNLGKSGLKVSALSLGSWLTFGEQIDDKTASRLMSIAYERGVNFFDNAEVYANGKSEEVMGKILSKKKWDRSTWLVSSKVFWGGEKPNQKGLSRKHIFEACDAALKRLRVDYLDLYFCHRPDVETPIEETVWAMHNLVQQGKILYWGTSEWTAQQLTQAYLTARNHHLIEPSMEQPQYNMFHRQKMELDYLPLFKDFGMGTTIWSPLASGLLTGKYLKEIPENSRLSEENLAWLKKRMLTPERLEMIRHLDKIAQKAGTTLTKFSIAWCLANPNVSTVILGAKNEAQLHENLDALEALPLLTQKVLEETEKALKNKPVADWF